MASSWPGGIGCAKRSALSTERCQLINYVALTISGGSCCMLLLPSSPSCQQQLLPEQLQLPYLWQVYGLPARIGQCTAHHFLSLALTNALQFGQSNGQHERW